MNPSDELKQASLDYAVNWTKPRLPEAEIAALSAAFETGAAYQDPIARREERERILRILRRAEEFGDEWAEYVEEKLK